MIEMFFSIKFRSQLARTRPELLSAIENGIINSVRMSGANVRRENKAITALFDEHKIGFWLDIIFVIETIRTLLEKNKRELYGHACIFAQSIDVDTADLLKKSLSCVDDASAVWCAENITGEIKSFAEFNNDEYQNEEAHGVYCKLDTLKNFPSSGQKYPLRKKIEKILLVDKYRNTILLGREFIGKADCLEWYCREENGFFTPFVIQFNKYGSALNCFIDAFASTMRQLCEEDGPPERLAALYESLFAGRLRRELSASALVKAAELLNVMVDTYLNKARTKPLIPVIILENIQNAPPAVSKIFIDCWTEAAKKRRVVILGSSRNSEVSTEWRQVFPGVISCTVENAAPFDFSVCSQSLLEIAYTCHLFGKFFPAHCFIQLFEEEGKNAEVLQKSLKLLVNYGIIRSVDAPSPGKAGFEGPLEEALGGRTAFIKSVVKDRLLSWVAQGKIAPCFDLLEALNGLGYSASSLLTLDCIKADIINGTHESIENALREGRFSQIASEEFAPSLLYIYKTLSSLVYGSEEEIHQTFKTNPPAKIPNPEFKALILSIQALYRMGISDTQTALDEIKESMILYQGTKERAGISLVYRIFSLINLSRQEINDAIDYLNYAAEYNKISKDINEQTLGYYYSSVVHFVFGNISKAQRIIYQAIESAEMCGRLGWALKSEFMLARYCFETGEYNESKKIFTTLLQKYEDAKNPVINEVIHAWIERTKLYLGEKHTLLKDLRCDDAILFRLEETYLNGEYAETAELAGKLLTAQAKDEFVFLEQPCWTSGFAQCELLPFSKKDFWGRVTPVWRSLALSKMGGAEEAVHIMQKIMRDERLNETDPNMPFYFFANYRIVHEAGLSEVDRNTAISMAFKRLQRRAGRIDDVKVRQSYLTNQYWNNALFTTAKEYKLI
ncbi:MAG: hypothetical protein LBG74_00920 [Spirochaetaceae bacterium]|jgi:tetratricopeptide (TPR) repeat protein|nr:hypothetical protein [Spirochaetaceae bacterium]